MLTFASSIPNKKFKGMTTSKEVAKALKELLPNHTMNDVHFVCIGTDRSTGDALGPLVGKMMHDKGHRNLVGTLSDPVHAMNLDETLASIKANVHSSKTIIGIDACLGQVSSVGTIQAAIGPVRPGAGVNKDLPPVGDIHITAIVNVGGFMEYFVLQNTRLNLVMELAASITEGIEMAFVNE